MSYTDLTSIFTLNSLLTYQNMLLLGGNEAFIKDIYDQQIAFMARTANSTTVPTATPTKITLDTEIFDTNNYFASSRFTPLTAGKYILVSNINFDTSGNDESWMMIYKNGVEHRRGERVAARNPSGGFVLGHNISAIVEANGTTDYFEIYGNTTAAGGAVTAINADRIWFGGAMILERA